MFELLGFAAQVCVICIALALIVDMHGVVSAEHDALVSAVSLPQSSTGYEVEMSTSFNGELCSWDDPRLQHQCFDDSDDSGATLPIASASIPCVMVKAAIITTTISEFEPYPDINSMTVKQLKSYAKSAGFTGYSALRKAELVALLSEF